MSQPDTIATPVVFHPDGIAALAALAGASVDHPDWHDDALCAQTDPEAFFPEKGGSTREAKQICHRCPVRTECLADALASDTRFGVWGGLTERERRVLRRDRPAEQATGAQPVVPQPRRAHSGQRRESTSPRGRSAGPGVAATLPTEPRDHRPHLDRPDRPSSTFPDRARARPLATPEADHAPEQVSPRPPSRSAGRRSRTKPATRATRTGHRRSAPTPTTTPGAATATTAVATAAGSWEADTGDDAAAAVAGQTPPGPEPVDRRAGQPPSKLRDAMRLVLAGQDGQPGAGDVDLASVYALASTMANGSSVAGPAAAETGRWEWRIAAVAAVVSGALTRGQTGRLMGERSQDIAHWVRRHLEGMPLAEPEHRARTGER